MSRSPIRMVTTRRQGRYWTWHLTDMGEIVTSGIARTEREARVAVRTAKGKYLEDSQK